MSKPSWEEFKASFVASIESGSSVEEATANATGQNKRNNTGGTSAASPNKTDAEVLAAKIQGRKDTDAYLREQEAQQAYTDNFRNTQSHKWADYHYGEYLKQANDAQTNGRGTNSYARTDYLNKAANNGNPVEQITVTELYDRNARSADYDKVQADIAAYKDYMNAADEAESFKQKAVQNQYGNADGVIAKAERDAAEARKNAEEIADSLKRNYGITTNGLRVDTDAFNTAYFDEALKAAKTAEANKPIDTIGMLTGTSMDYMDASTTDMLKSASEDDKVLYSYLLEQDKKNGTNIAPAFQLWLKDNQARARGTVKAEEIENMDEGLGKVLAYGGRAVGSGLTGALNDVRDSITGEQGARSINEYAAEQLRQGLVDDNRKGATFFFDAAQSVGAMAPGLTAGIINPALGAAVFATTTGASGYQDKLDEGWTQSDAMSYGIATAIAEGGLQYVTGGISNLGNMAPVIKAAVDSIPKPILRALAGAGVRGSAEFVEEFIQTYLDPAIVSVLQGTAYDTPEFREALRNGLLGAATSLGLGGGDFINDLRNSQPSQNVDSAPSVEGGEITPPAPQKAEQTASGELNSQATPNAEAAKSNLGQNALLEVPVLANRSTANASTVNTSKAPDNAQLLADIAAGKAESPLANGGKTVPTQSRFLEDKLTAEERQIEGLTEEDFVHEQRHDATVNAEADQRIVADGIERSQEILVTKDPKSWNDTDVATAKKIISADLEVARQLSGEEAAKAYAKVAEIAKAYRDSGTETARALRQRRGSFDNSADGIIASATETLFGDDVKTRKGVTDERKIEIVNQVADLATRYNNIPDGDVDGVVSMIKEVNVVRGTTGLFSKETSKSMEWALEEAKNFPDAEEFLSEVLATQIKSIAGDYVAPTVTSSVKSYRIMSLLSKISTFARNIVSNGIFDPMEALSNNVAVPLDMLLSTFTGTRSTTFERGRLSSSAKRKGTTEGMIRSMIQVGLDADISNAPTKYDQKAGRNFKMTGNVLERFLSTWEKYENYALRTTDEMSKGGIRAEKQRGIDALIAAGKAKEGSLDERAQNVALERTYQDDSWVSNTALTLRDAANKIAHVGDIGAGDLLMPFAKVPANVVKSAITYTPANVVDTTYRLYDVLSAAHKGSLTAEQQAKLVQSFGRTVMGVGLTYASSVLALAGVIKAVDEEDKDKATAEKAAGQSGTQINLDAFWRLLNNESTEWREYDKLMNIAFIQPINANLTLGIALAEAKKNDEELTLAKIEGETVKALAKSMRDFPAVSQIGNMVNNFKYSDKDSLEGKAMDVATGFAGDVLGSFIPNAVRGIAAGTDPYIRDVYSKETRAGQAVDNVLAGIPGLRETLPVATDSWGNPKTQKTTPTLNFLNQNILPGAVNVYQPNAMMPELERLTEAGITGLYPDRSAPSKISDAELSYEDKQQYLKTANSLENKLYNEAVNSGFYKGLTDEQKGEWLKDIQSYAEAVADTAFRESKGIKTDKPSDTEKLLQGVDKPGTSNDVPALKEENVLEYLLFSSQFSKLTGKNDYSGIDALLSNFDRFDENTKDVINNKSFSNLSGLLKFKNSGSNAETYYTVKDAVGEKQWDMDVNSSTGSHVRLAGLASADIPNEEKDKLVNSDAFELSKTGKAAYEILRSHNLSPEIASAFFEYADWSQSAGKEGKADGRLTAYEVATALSKLPGLSENEKSQIFAEFKSAIQNPDDAYDTWKNRSYTQALRQSTNYGRRVGNNEALEALLAAAGLN